MGLQQGKRSLPEGRWSPLKRRELLAGATLLAATWARGSRAAAPPSLRPLKVGYIPVEACAQYFVAAQHGLFEKQGLQVAGIAMAGGATIAPAVEGGTIDVGWSNTISLIIARAQGFDFRILTPGVYEIRGQGGARRSVMVPADSPIRRPEELAGKTVAINTLGNVSELVMVAWLERHGVPRDRVRLVEIDYPQMPPALSNHRVDAALVIDPFVTVIERQGIGRSLAEYVFSEAVTDRFFIASWFAKGSWIAANRDLVSRFQQAVQAATELIGKDPEATRRAIAAFTRINPAVLAQMQVSVYPDRVFVEDLQVLIEACVRYGFISKGFPAQELLV